MRCNVVGLDKYKDLTDKVVQDMVKQFNVPSEEIEGIEKIVKNKYSIKKYEDITEQRHMYENFFYLKTKIKRGEKTFDLKDEPLLNQIIRTKIDNGHGNWLSEGERDMLDKEKFSKWKVMVSQEEYDRISHEVSEKGKATIYCKYGFLSHAYMKDGKLFDSDGDREIMVMDKNIFSNGKMKITNPIMKKFWEIWKPKGMNDEQIMKIWDNLGTRFTEELYGKDLSEITFETHSINTNPSKMEIN